MTRLLPGEYNIEKCGNIYSPSGFLLNKIAVKELLARRC
jgi:hypothetical protein